MPAVLRGGRRQAAKPRAKAPQGPSRTRVQAKGPAPYTPAKLRAVRGAGLAPRHAVIAAGAVFAIAAVAMLATGDRAERLAQATGQGAGNSFAGLGFKLHAVRVEGASAMATADIVRAAGLAKDQPVLAMDLDAIRGRVEQVGWVKQARVVRLLPDTLVLSVVERGQMAVWQHGGRAFVIDDKGKVIPEADAGRFASLPLVVGAGANEHAPEILPAVAQRPRLMERLEAMVRVDDRRWDLRLKDGSLVQLPAVGEEEALIQLEQLDQRTRILELGFERIDLRDPATVAVRPRDGALPGQLVAGGA